MGGPNHAGKTGSDTPKVISPGSYECIPHLFYPVPEDCPKAPQWQPGPEDIWYDISTGELHFGTEPLSNDPDAMNDWYTPKSNEFRSSAEKWQLAADSDIALHEAAYAMRSRILTNPRISPPESREKLDAVMKKICGSTADEALWEYRCPLFKEKIGPVVVDEYFPWESNCTSLAGFAAYCAPDGKVHMAYGDYRSNLLLYIAYKMLEESYSEK